LCAGTLAWHVSACEVPDYGGPGAELDAGVTDPADAKLPPHTPTAVGGEPDTGVSRAPSDEHSSVSNVDRNDASARVPEAGPPDAAPSAAEAGADPIVEPVAGGLPAWAQPLLGTYAKRSTDFSYDDNPSPPINTRNVEHSIVKVVQNGSVLEWTSQLCSYAVSIKGSPGTPPLNLPNTAGMPPLKGHLTLGAPGSFSAAPMLQHLGFDPARGTCDTSNRRTKFDDQTWISGATCTCYATSVPEHVDDCRVIDGDADGKPGIIARGPSPLGTTISNYAMVFDYSVTISDGTIKPDRAHELHEVRAQQPGCINTAVDGCSFGNNQLCPGVTTRLLPVDDAVTCATLNTGDFGPAESFPVEANCRAKPAR
jgi:hypothetical protein